MPSGIFTPFENPVRFFARPRAFTIECVYCGRLLLVGKGERDAKCFNRVTSVITCLRSLHRTRDEAKRLGGCGRSFFVGMVAWPIRPGARGKGKQPEDQIPDYDQAAEIREIYASRFARRTPKRYGESFNQIEPPVDTP